ncbi:MAG TPA: hypothetical protein VD963_09280 [Phycisphaerales bacterium]|nr:hypothetical protein [Phycisphaerales bacterium]
MRSTVAALAVLSTAPALAGIPDIYGITFSGALIGIDASTGAATLIGTTGLFNCESLERDPATGHLLAIASHSPSFGGRRLYRINPVTAVPTFIGDSGFPWVEALAYNAGTGVMYASVSPGNDVTAEQLATINITTGDATTIATTNMGDIDAMACSPSGVLYASHLGSGVFGAMDPATGQVASPMPGVPLLAALDFAPDGTLFASKLGSFEGTGPSSLYIIDPATGAGTLVGSMGFSHVSGLVVNVPAPGALGLLAGGACLAARRRR